MSPETLAWRRARRGLVLIGIGLLLLANTEGWLRWSVWAEALTFWPVLLIAAGLRVAFGGSRWPWLTLLSPALILGTLAWVAWGRPQRVVQDWSPLSATRPEGIERWTLDGEMAMAELEAEARPLPPGALAEGRAAGRDVRLRVVADGTRARVLARSDRWAPFATLRDPARWELGLAPDLPLRVEMDLAFDRGRLDLARAPVTAVDLEGAFNDLLLSLGPPAADVHIRLSGAFNRWELVVPHTTPVRVRTDGPLLWVDGRNQAADLSGPGYDLRVDGAMSSVTVRSSDAGGPSTVAHPVPRHAGDGDR
jgi:LiaI-LiaF-like transmembrane region